MTLAKGDPIAFRALKRGPLADYLLALDNFVEPAAAPPPSPADEVGRTKIKK